jgi:hypothetical protein
MPRSREPYVFGQKANGRWFVKGRDHNPYTWARVLMANELGYWPSSDQHVHHINGDKTDDRIENLMLISKWEHMKHHPEAGRASWGPERREALNAKRRDIQRRYLAGELLDQIAAAHGIKDATGPIRFMREAGWYMPYRYPACANKKKAAR